MGDANKTVDGETATRDVHRIRHCVSSRRRIIAECLCQQIQNESWKMVEPTQTKQQLKSMNQSTCTHSSDESNESSFASGLQ